LLKNPDKIRAVVELLKRRRRGGKSAAERKHESLVRHGYNSIDRRDPADPKRRKRLEGKPELWLRWYFPNIFTLPFSDGHRAIIRAVLESDASGKNMVVAAPRGEGKTFQFTRPRGARR
jgi:hypothetical protein